MDTVKSAGQRFGEALDAEGRGARKTFATDAGVDQSLVTRWIDGSRKPNTAQRVFILNRFPKARINILDWDEEQTLDEGNPAA